MIRIVVLNSRITNSKLIKSKVMKEGTVKFFNETKGFGFIKMNDGEQDVFVHSSNLIDNIRDDDQVTFDIEQSDRGPSAINVRLA